MDKIGGMYHRFHTVKKVRNLPGIRPRLQSQFRNIKKGKFGRDVPKGDDHSSAQSKKEEKCLTVAILVYFENQQSEFFRLYK
jgi:hypothetical protein